MFELTSSRPGPSARNPGGIEGVPANNEVCDLTRAVWTARVDRGISAVRAKWGNGVDRRRVTAYC